MVRPIVVWEEGNEVLSAQRGLGIIGTLFAQLPLDPRFNRTRIPENLHPDIGHRDGGCLHRNLGARQKRL